MVLWPSGWTHFLSSTTLYLMKMTITLWPKLAKTQKEYLTGHHSPSIFANIFGFGYIGVFIMLYLNANNFIKIRSNKKGHIPICFGRFQRNVLTFKQTLIFGGLNSIFSCQTSMFILLKKHFGIVLNHKYYCLALFGLS